MPGSSPYLSHNDHTGPEWLDALRRRGHSAWSASSMPGASEEDWKYVDLDFALEDYRPAGPPSGGLEPDEYLNALGRTSGYLSIVDGVVVAAEGDGVEVAAVLDMPAEQISGHYGAAVSPDLDIFAAANHAFGPPGGAVTFPAGRSVQAPVVVDVQSVSGGTVSFPHVNVIAGPGSEGTVMLVYRSAPDADLLVSPVVEVLADQNARVTLLVVQRLDSSARMVAHHHLIADRDATVRTEEIGLGSRYARQRLGITLAGSGSSAQMSGIYFGDGSQVLDYRIFVTHSGPRTTSDILLKGAVADRAEAVWTGLMRVEKSAMGTSAFETNRNLILSDKAKVHSVPNLEILTDDLQCGHGSSSGPLEEEHLYYLMSRGLPRDRSERLLVRGFFDEVLSNLAVPDLAGPARNAVSAKFAGAQQRGEI